MFDFILNYVIDLFILYVVMISKVQFICLQFINDKQYEMIIFQI